MGDEEIALVTETIRSGWITQGPRVAEFEREFARYVDAPHAVAVSSCTTGLHLCLKVLGVGHGDEVIVTPHSFIASANAIRYCGATPVFVDIDPATLNMAVERVPAAITPRTRAILVVHQVGRPADLAPLQRLAEELGIEAAVVRDLEEVCRGHVLKAFGDLYRRTFRDMNNDGVVQGYSRFILPMLGLGIDKVHQARYQALASSAPGSLGAGLHAYYDHNGFPYPGSRQGLPYDYVAAHDVHHVIGGYATDPDGELQVLAFSMGLFPDHALLIAIPPLMQFQVGIADPLASSVAPKLTDQLRAPAFAAALERGANVVGPIRDLHWDFWEWIDRPLEEVRRDLNVP